MARKKQDKAIYTINQKVTIQGLGECIITDIHDDDGIRLEVYKAKDEGRRFKNRYIVPESDVVPTDDPQKAGNLKIGQTDINGWSLLNINNNLADAIAAKPVEENE